MSAGLAILLIVIGGAAAVAIVVWLIRVLDRVVKERYAAAPLSPPDRENKPSREPPAGG